MLSPRKEPAIAQRELARERQEEAPEEEALEEEEDDEDEKEALEQTDPFIKILCSEAY